MGRMSLGGERWWIFGRFWFFVKDLGFYFIGSGELGGLGSKMDRGNGNLVVLF